MMHGNSNIKKGGTPSHSINASKGKVILVQAKRHTWQAQLQLLSALISAPDRGQWSAPRPGNFITTYRILVPIEQEAGWAQSWCGYFGDRKIYFTLSEIKP